MRVVCLGLMLMGLTACSLFDTNSKASVAQGHWQAYATSIPVIDLPAGMMSRTVQTYYVVPPAHASKPQAMSSHDGIYLPPADKGAQ